MSGFGIGAPASGITLHATSSPFQLLPPEVWDGFRKAVKAAADAWGIQVAVSEHPTIQEAKQRYWAAQRQAQLAAIDEAAKRSE